MGVYKTSKSQVNKTHKMTTVRYRKICNDLKRQLASRKQTEYFLHVCKNKIIQVKKPYTEEKLNFTTSQLWKIFGSVGMMVWTLLNNYYRYLPVPASARPDVYWYSKLLFVSSKLQSISYTRAPSVDHKKKTAKWGVTWLSIATTNVLRGKTIRACCADHFLGIWPF